MEIFTAIRSSRVDEVEALLQHGADVNIQRRTGYTPLHIAEDASVVKVLLRYGANLSIKDRSGSTPLHRAFMLLDNYGAVDAMLEGHGQCQENPVNAKGFSHLHIACLRGSEAAVKGILEHSIVDINAPTPHPACTKMDKDYLHCYQVEDNGWTPLHLTVSQRDDTRIAQVLLDAGAKVNVKGLHFKITPLHVAALFNRPNHVELLLKRGADSNAKGMKRQGSSLHVACQKRYVKIVRLLLEHGADPNAKQKERWGDTPLHLCARAADNDANSNDDHRGSIIRLLVEAGADLNACNFHKRKPIVDASDSKDERPLRALLFYCSNIDERTTDKLISKRMHSGHSIAALLEHLEVLRHTNRSNATSHDDDLFKRIYETGLYSEDEVTSIRNVCHKEIKVLREMGLDFCLTYSNVVRKNAIEVDRLWQRSEKLVELVKSNELRRFPVYGDRLRRWYDDLQRAPSCLDQALLIVKKHWNLDHYSAMKIFGYLNAKELGTMVQAYEF